MNLKNFKKGFTLVELLAVIAIIGVIITLSLASYKSIKDKTLKKDKDNLISYIETAAEKYIHDTGIAKLNIETLITEGYISPDDEKGYIYDPVTKEVLNCYVINAEYKEGKYEAKLSEEKQEKDGKCKISIEMLLDICVYDDKEGCKEISSDSWFAENVKLAVKKNNEIKILEEGKFNWLSNTGFEGHDSIIGTNIKNNGEVTYKVKVYDSNDTFIGEAQKTIKIDLKKPNIINVNVPDGWLQSKTVTVEATDGIISGIYGYSFNTNNNCLATYQLGNTKNYTSNGSYYVCVKDKAGNVTGPKEFSVDKIDTEPPVYVNGTGALSIECKKLSITGVVYNDRPEQNSGVTNKYYYISTSSTKPLSNAKGWQTGTTFATECDNTYHVWSKARDKVGNESEITSLGFVSKPCCTDTEEYYGCSDKGYDISDKGWKLYRIKTECTGVIPPCKDVYFKKTRTDDEACITDTVCGAYGDCKAEGWQYAPCWHYEGGNKIDDSEAKEACTYCTWSAWDYGDCGTTGKKTRTKTCYTGGVTSTSTDIADCGTCEDWSTCSQNGYQHCTNPNQKDWKQSCDGPKTCESYGSCQPVDSTTPTYRRYHTCTWKNGGISYSGTFYDTCYCVPEDLIYNNSNNCGADYKTIDCKKEGNVYACRCCPNDYPNHSGAVCCDR